MFFHALISTLMMGKLAFCINGGADADAVLYQAYGYISEQGSNEPTCGATLITNRHIITIAFCLQNWQERRLFVQLGVTDWCNGESVLIGQQWSYFLAVYLENYPDREGALGIGTLAITIENIVPMGPRPNAPIGVATFGICGMGVYDPASNRKSCTLRQAELVYRMHHHACSRQWGLICADPKKTSPQSGSMCYQDQGGPVVECYNQLCYLSGIQWKTVDGSCTGTNIMRSVSPALPWIHKIIRQG